MNLTHPTSTPRSSLQRWIAEAGGWRVGTLWRAPLGPTQERLLKAPSCLLPEVCIRRQQGEAPAQSFWKVLTAVSQGWDPMQGACVHHAALRVVPIMASGWVSFLLSWSRGPSYNRHGCPGLGCRHTYCFSISGEVQRKVPTSQRKKELPASGSDQVKLTALAGIKCQRVMVSFHFIENRQLFHRETPWRARVHSPGHSAHNQVPGAGGAHHSEHGRCAAASLPPLGSALDKCPSDLSLVLWIQLSVAIMS